MTLSHTGRAHAVFGLLLLLPTACSQQPATAPAGPATPQVAAPKAAPAAPRGPAAHKTTADELTREVVASESAARAKYDGKVVEVTGEVDTANKNITDNGFSLKGAKRNPTDVVGVIVICSVPPAALGKAWRLGRGQKVKVVGTARISSAVYLNDCTFEPLEPSATPTVTAKSLAEEVTKDAGTARKKYQTAEGYSKPIIVEGVVAALGNTNNGLGIAKLAGADGITINCTMKKEDFAKVKVGDAVTIKGDFSNYYPNEKGVTVESAFLLPKE